MPLYSYRALGPGGESRQGTIEGSNEAEVLSRLRKKGVLVLRLSPALRGDRLLGLQIGGNATIRGGELVDITRELASMLGAGQDLDRALRMMIEGAANRRIAGVLSRIRGRVRDGTSLAAALEQEEKTFSRLYVGPVSAGEAGGALGETLERLAGLLERQRSLTATVQSALIYPAIPVVAAVGSIVLLITNVLPQFVPLFAENGVALPASTAFLLGVGDAVSAYGVPALAALLLLGLVGRTMLRRPAVRRMLDAALLRLPILGGLLRDVIAGPSSPEFPGHRGRCLRRSQPCRSGFQARSPAATLTEHRSAQHRRMPPLHLRCPLCSEALCSRSSTGHVRCSASRPCLAAWRAAPARALQSRRR
jgi:general secretion pathway protein F